VISALYSSLSDNITTLPELLQEKGYATAALTSNPFFSRAYNFQQGFDQFDELFDMKRIVIGHDFLGPFEKLVEGVMNKPFFIYLHLREPHTPYAMPEPFFGKYQKNFERRSRSFHKEVDRILAADSRDPSEIQFMTDVYDENLAYADRIVGKLHEILRKNKILDNTLTIITSDHGEGLGEHELLGHNVVLHKEGIHVPLIFHLPGIKDGEEVIANPAITSDIAVTLSELLDIDYPYSELSRGKNLFFLPKKRTRICRSIVLSSQYSGYVIDSFPYRAIIFPTLGQWNFDTFNISENPEATRALSDDDFQKAALKFFLNQFIENTARGFRAGKEPKLGEKEKERLKALGYIK
jgi:arylsulfatase A-like enzyme